MEDYRVCRKCKAMKTLDHYSPARLRYYYYVCRACDSVQASRYRKSHPYVDKLITLRAHANQQDGRMWSSKLVETVFRCFDHRSALSGATDNLTLARWYDWEGWTPSNVIVCTAPEVRQLVGLRRRLGGDPSKGLSPQQVRRVQECLNRIKLEA